jgi:multiple sugar transport system substrate-binding protein
MNRKKETFWSQLHGLVTQLDRPLPPGEGQGEGLVQSRWSLSASLIVVSVKRSEGVLLSGETGPHRNHVHDILRRSFRTAGRRQQLRHVSRVGGDVTLAAERLVAAAPHPNDSYRTYPSPQCGKRIGSIPNKRSPILRCLGPVLLLMLLLLSCRSHHDAREHLEFWGLGREGEVVKDLIPEFERRNPGIKVTVQQIPFTAAHEKLLTAHVGESTPDLAQMGNTWIPEFAAMRALADLGPFAGAAIDRGDYFDGVWDTNVVDRVLYGIPWYVDTRVVFYRSDILAAVGFPKGPRTWSEWSEAMKRIREQGRARWAILLPTNEWEPIVMLGLSSHSTLLNAEGTQGEFRAPPFTQAFDFYVQAFRNGYAPAVSNSQIANLYQQFAQGDFAMYITGPWNVGEFKNRLPANMQDKWATCPLPARDASESTGVSMAAGSSLVIFELSKHKAAAQKLIEFLSEPKQQVRFFELTGDLPARRSAWRAAALMKERHLPAFREQLEHVKSLPKVPEWEQIATAIFDRGEAAARGVEPPTAALAALDVKTDSLLEKRRWMLSRKREESSRAAVVVPAAARPAQ